MRLKIYTGRDVKAAMAKVRDDLGNDAIIINVDENAPGGVRISAAYEPPIIPEETQEDIAADGPAAISAPFTPKSLATSLRFHGLPPALAEKVTQGALLSDAEDLDHALAAGLEGLLNFSGFAHAPTKPILLVGPPGAGKTSAVAKIAADARMRGQSVQVYSTDLTRSAGVTQLELLCQKLDLMVTTADSAQELRYLLKQPNRADVQIIDTTGVNAYNIDDAQRIARFAAQSGAEPIFVLPAGLDGLEAAEQAYVFSSLGVKRMLVTRLDGARRFAGIVTALYKGRMALAGLSASPFVADSFITATPLNLARFLLSKPDPARLGIVPKDASAAPKKEAQL
ncbi:MAG: AAA family ATPase [Pseudomonadota bacterium]